MGHRAGKNDPELDRVMASQGNPREAHISCDDVMISRFAERTQGKTDTCDDVMISRFVEKTQ